MVRYLIILPTDQQQLEAAHVTGRLLSEQVEKATIGFLGDKQHANLFFRQEWLPFFDWEMRGLKEKLKSNHFDYIIDMENSWRTFRLKSSLKVLDFTIGNSFLKKAIGRKSAILSSEELIGVAIKKLSVFDIEDDGKRP